MWGYRLGARTVLRYWRRFAPAKMRRVENQTATWADVEYLVKLQRGLGNITSPESAEYWRQVKGELGK